MLRKALQEQFSRPGNVHWGTLFDVKALSEVLDIGILIFCDRLQNNGRNCLSHVEGEKHSFPYWICIWWNEPQHFRLAELSDIAEGQGETGEFNCFWAGQKLPPLLYREYRQCNRAI